MSRPTKAQLEEVLGNIECERDMYEAAYTDLRKSALAVVEWLDDPTPRSRPAAMASLLERLDDLRAVVVTGESLS